MWLDTLLEKDQIPDYLIRTRIRQLLAQRLEEQNQDDVENQHNRLMKFIDHIKSGPIAIATAEANEQHYEVPTAFYQYCLGSHLKYSCGYWNDGVTDLDKSELDMLELTCQRADLVDGQHVLELGCGWGSLSLFMAARFPNSHITGVSNSRTQKQHIDTEAASRGITNLNIITADMNAFEINRQFDRVVSVEMFEHMRNYQLLLQKVASFLKTDGKLFVHIFTHKEFAYLFEVKDETDWMSKYFFTGGMMPSDDLLLYFNDHLTVKNHWRVNGTHYGKTSEAWLSKMDSNRKQIMPLFEQTYGRDNALKWWVYWRIFYMSCAELWNYEDGNEWMVSHYLLEKNH